ncbi:hypothetical protein WSM22_18800 [Cytophagales bacterium WSM2-2]|nr:hypothetical protein WSM22_18800 [Cytophagales bacterium WSM2-2]
MPNESQAWEQVNKAFSKQSPHFDSDDFVNPVLQHWRTRIYQHVDRFIHPNSKILELNAGTGIDAIRFAQSGHQVHATDLSDGMISTLKTKIAGQSLQNKITIQQVSFEELNKVDGTFDYVFSNFGGLNCSADLDKVTKYLRQLLNKNGIVTWVIMPRITPWEWLWVFRGKPGSAFRRFRKNGAAAHLEGEIFMTYYYSVAEIRKSLSQEFQIIKTEGLGFFSPPPAALNFVKKFPGISSFLEKLDCTTGKLFPFNRWGDHVIVTFSLRDRAS